MPRKPCNEQTVDSSYYQTALGWVGQGGGREILAQFFSFELAKGVAWQAAPLQDEAGLKKKVSVWGLGRGRIL